MNQRVLKMEFGKIYAMYVEKVVKKGRTQSELDTIIYWLTGHSEGSLRDAVSNAMCVGEFFSDFPRLNENARLITGTICGYKVEEIHDPLEKNMRYLDKLVDELAKGRRMEKILRQ